jgi:hypothetical protein
MKKGLQNGGCIRSGGHCLYALDESHTTVNEKATLDETALILGSLFHFKPGYDYYEEHEVVLIWSVKSAKARLFWNGKDISRLFPANIHQWPSMSTLEFAWGSSRCC